MEERIWKQNYESELERALHHGHSGDRRGHKHLFRIAEKLVNTVESPQGMNEWSRMFVVREGVKYLKNYFLEHAAGKRSTCAGSGMRIT